MTGAGLPLHASGESQALGWIEGKLRDAVLAGSGSGGGAAAAAAAASGGVLRREAGASGGGHGAGGGDGVAGVVLVREAVEVKNSCPFVYKGQRKARKRGINIHVGWDGVCACVCCGRSCCVGMGYTGCRCAVLCLRPCA